MFRYTALIAAFILSACGSVDDYSGAYAKYDKDFRLQHPLTVHEIDRDGQKLNAREFKAASNSGNENPPIILMHGFPDSLHLYDRLAPLLTAQRQVVSFDFLGWGNSDKPQNHIYDVASMRADLEAVIAHFKFDKFVLVVHDSSGHPGIDYALDNPTRVAELVLLNTFYAPSDSLVPPPAIRRFSTPGIARDLLVFGTGLSDARWQSGYLEQVGQFFDDDKMREKYLPIFAHQAMKIRTAFIGLNHVLREEIMARQDRLDELRQLSVPTKIIFGAEDPFLNTKVAREFDNYLPNSQLLLVKGAAHYVQLDKPQTVANFILK